MQDIHTMLATLRRPALLMRAAHIGAKTYRRALFLPHLLGYGTLPRHGPAVLKLLEMESALNDQRKAKDADYNLVRHVDVMIAIVAEADALRAQVLENAAL